MGKRVGKTVGHHDLVFAFIFCNTVK